jgi:putative ATP-binding cassette transporter
LKARNKTVLVITHDDRYFHLADRIIKLDYGQVQTQHSGRREPFTDMLDADTGAHPAPVTTKAALSRASVG